MGNAASDDTDLEVLDLTDRERIDLLEQRNRALGDRLDQVDRELARIRQVMAGAAAVASTISSTRGTAATPR